jgi:U4/U6.U5 tri-snRNP-associated protein 2
MNLHDTRVYCLPDGYEVLDSSLDDIKRCLQPVFTHEEIMALSRDNTTLARDVHGVSYLPGFVGLNNLNQTDYVNTVLHALAHIVPIRDFFLNPINYTDSKSSLVTQFGKSLRYIRIYQTFCFLYRLLTSGVESFGLVIISKV